MRRIFSAFFGGRLQSVLITSFVFVAIVTAGLNTLVISRVIDDYLTSAQVDRVGRDMDLADGLYQQKMTDVAGIGQRTATDPQSIANLPATLSGDPVARHAVDQAISRNLTEPLRGSSEVGLILDGAGNILIGRALSVEGKLSEPLLDGNWGSLPIVADALTSSQPLTGTEVIPAALLDEIGLAEQAYVPLRETAQAAPDRFDAREGAAGLALVSVYPLRDEHQQVLGMVVTAYLFNNDSSFVDYLIHVARIETSTVFLGDLRVSTNVVDTKGARAVGTRVSQAVYDPVLRNGGVYFGRVFVVSDWYIGKYQPLRDHSGSVVGMLYVGARDATFRHLVDDFTRQAVLIAFVCIIVAGILALPISRWITWPISDLVQATRRLASGDMNVRIEPYGRGEFALLGRSFNSMVETLGDNQQELLRKDKLASMGQLAAGVAHELNNPLGTILLYSGAMYAEVSEDDPRRDDIKMIISEAERCKVIVADLLNFARQHELMTQETDLNQLLQEIVNKVAPQPRFERLELRCHLDPKLPIIQADPAQLQQVFINLLTNSSDAIKGPGIITITTRLAASDFVEVLVTDTGSGIPPESLGKLFTPFFTTKPAGKGTGLGLAIVYGIVKMHRGQIRVESQVGHGTTMIITLPTRFSDSPPHHLLQQTDMIA
jgi:two-component system, NtrC family, sensor kinase